METEKQRKARKDFEGLFKDPLKNLGGLIIWIIVLILIYNQ